MQFGSNLISMKNIFYSSQKVFCLVNLKPTAQGHVLVCPVRKVQRYNDLLDEEALEIWHMGRHLGKVLRSHYNAKGIVYAVQDTREKIKKIERKKGRKKL
eukprot:TRINITY_DN5068_c0_g2_i2.p1 TRINITY_DN5068_c0_g2~~TRINITY_DN5068_c0_g2_i2.p1  ORF type:complete len:100 (-),score=16.67 TRINITY_DN5068_c0_g2_i2:198-497(-)